MDEHERTGPRVGPPLADDVDDMSALLVALRTAGRQDDAETARFPVDLAPSLSEATRARISEQILRAQVQERAAGTPTTPARVAHDGSGGNTSVAGVDALAERRARAQSRRTILLGGGGVVLAAAAALMLWMRPSAEDPALPAYSVTASGGVAEVRGARPDSTSDGQTTVLERVRAESELRVTCRPDNAVEGPVAVRAFFVQGLSVEEMKPLVEVAPTGAVDLRLRGADLVGRHRGPGSLRVVVGRPDVVRSIDPHAAARTDAAAAEASGNHQRWLTVPVDIDGV